MMKKIIIVFISFVIIGNVYSQSRTAPTFAKITKKSEKLTKATGWAKNSRTNEWISNINCISERKYSPSMSPAPEILLSIQTWKLFYLEKTYYAIISESKKAGFILLKRWLVFSEKEYKSIKYDINKLNSTKIVAKSRINGSLNNRNTKLGGDASYTENNLIKLITRSLNDSTLSFDAYVMNSQHSDGEDTVRFRLQSYGSQDLEEKYFEVSLNEFNKIFL